MAKRIIVWDNRRPEAVGTVYEQERRHEFEEQRGAFASMPVDERMLEVSAIGGYFRRDWGLPGVAFRDMLPAKQCPMLLWVTPDVPYLHFAVHVRADVEQGVRPRGVLRLSPGASPTGAFTGGIGAVGSMEIVLDDLAKNVPEEELAGASWILAGRSKVSVQIDGYLSCCLNGVAEGVRVLWTAVTQSSQER